MRIAASAIVWSNFSMQNPGSGDLARRVEEACLNGWPALREVVLDGWLLRFADGHTRRANSVNPIAPCSRDARENVRYCEALYAAQNLPAIFRIPAILPSDLGGVLDTLGYAPAEDETRVLYASLTAPADQEVACGGVEIGEGDVTEEWLGSYARLAGQSEPARRGHAKILRALSIPAAFAMLRAEDGEPVSVAFGALHDGTLCVNSVVTDPACRRQGLSYRAISALLVWARRRRASGACVPVVATNAPAVALYERLGFRTEMYRYHYRRATTRPS